MMLQSALLAVGAWLVIHQESTAGIIIAGSILGGRALAPVDLAIANWRGFVGARQGWHRLSQLCSHLLPPAQRRCRCKPPAKDARRAERGGRARRASRRSSART